MTTLQELKRERARLEIVRKSKIEMAKIQAERKKLKKEIEDLKNPKTKAFKTNVKKGLFMGGRGLGYMSAKAFNILEKATRPEPRRRKKKR